MPTITILKRQASKGHLTSIDEANDTIAISGLARTAAGTGSLYTDPSTTAITIGSAGTPTTIDDNLIISGEIHGPSDGTGITIGEVGSGAATASALQLASFTTTERDTNLTGANGMLVYNETVGSAQVFAGAAWADFPGGGSGDVTAALALTDNTIIKGDGGAKGVQDTNIIISDVDEVRHAGTVELDKGADIASAATLTLGTDGNAFDVTGTTTITAVSAKAIGTRILLQFDGVLTVTHNATTLILAQGTNLVTAAGNHLELFSYDGTNWSEVSRSVGDPSTKVGATGDITTTSTTDIVATGMTITPIAGTYLVWFSTSVENDNDNDDTFISVYAGGAQEADSERQANTDRAPFASGLATTAKVIVNGSQAIEGRWSVSDGTGTLHERTLMILKVA